MEWTTEAEDAIKKVPFFVRKKVRKRIEKEALDAGKGRITRAEVQATQQRYLSGMSSEIKGYQIDGCFGPSGCPNRAHGTEQLLEKIEQLVKAEDLLGFLKSRVKEELKFHHEFRITFAECPNACSQPQIKDIGIIGACIPALTEEPCSQCLACVAACTEGALAIDEKTKGPRIDPERCLKCGRCIPACPTGTLAEGRKGFRVLLGGKLGRHPRLAREMPGVYSEAQVVEIVKACLDFYRKNSQKGQRFAEIFQESDFKKLSASFTLCTGNIR